MTEAFGVYIVDGAQDLPHQIATHWLFKTTIFDKLKKFVALNKLRNYVGDGSLATFWWSSVFVPDTFSAEFSILHKVVMGKLLQRLEFTLESFLYRFYKCGVLRIKNLYCKTLISSSSKLDFSLCASLWNSASNFIPIDSACLVRFTMWFNHFLLYFYQK